MSGKRYTPSGRRDPFVVDHARQRAVINQQEHSKKLEEMRKGWDRQDLRRRLERQRRDRTLMFLFFALAILVYIGGRAASPKLMVTLNQGQGKVMVDGAEKGRTGELIRDLPLGDHQVTVVPDDSHLVLIPPVEETVHLSWGLFSTNVQFDVAFASAAPDSTKTPRH